MSRTEPGLVWQKRTGREDHPVALRSMRIGPAFPSDPDHKPGTDETRKAIRGGKDTKAPRAPFRTVKPAGRVTAHCISCSWSATGRTWRPLRARLAAHALTGHGRIAA